MLDIAIVVIMVLVAAVIVIFLILIAINIALVLKLRSIIPPSPDATPPQHPNVRPAARTPGDNHPAARPRCDPG